MASTNLRSSCSFPYILLSILNFILFILSAISLAPIIALKMPPTSFGLAFLMVSSISLLSSFVGFYSHLAHFCYITHISLLLSSSIGQFLAILALFTREKSSLRMLKSARDPKEAKVLVRLECGIFMAMFVMQLAVVVLTCAVHSCWVREYEDIEAEKEAMARKRSRRIARVQEESVANAAKISEIKAKEFDEKMKNKYGQWVKNDFEGSRTGQPAPATFSNTDQTTVFHLFLQEKSRNCLSVLLEIERSMISTIMIHRAEFLRPYTHEFKNHQNFQRVSASWTMRTMDSKPSQKEELSVQVPKPQSETVSLSNLQFDRQRPPEEAFTKERRIDFGQFTTREAVLDEEFWQHGYGQKVVGRKEEANDMLRIIKGSLQNKNSIQSKGDANHNLATNPPAFWR